MVSVIVRNLLNLAFMRTVLQLWPFTGRYCALLGLHTASLGAIVAVTHSLDFPRWMGLLTVAGLLLPLTTCLGFLLGVLRTEDLRPMSRNVLRARSGD